MAHAPSPRDAVTPLAPVASVVAPRLTAARQTVAVAESSAGGLIAAALLAVPGASTCFLNGGVIDTQTARRTLLGVPDEAAAGVRSATEAYAPIKARAVRDRTGATWGMSETGAGGPTGKFLPAPGRPP